MIALPTDVVKNGDRRPGRRGGGGGGHHIHHLGLYYCVFPTVHEGGCGSECWVG